MSLTSLTAFGRRYANAWCSQDPARVASFYSPDGSLTVNDGPKAVGRDAIAEVARSFMADFPDMHVSMKGLIRDSRGTVFHWTLMGTNTGAGGTGQRVQIDGYEVWRIGADGLIAESAGHYDVAEWAFQLKNGVDAKRDEETDPLPPIDSRTGRRPGAPGRPRGSRPSGT